MLDKNVRQKCSTQHLHLHSLFFYFTYVVFEVVLLCDDVDDVDKEVTLGNNKSKNELVRSTRFLVLAYSPDHQESRTVLRLSVGP